MLPVMVQLAGCATMPSQTSLTTLQPVSFEIEQTPFFSQRRKQCGAAALATVLKFHGANVTAEQLEPYVYLPEREGAVSLELVAQTRRFGMVPYIPQGSLDALLAEVAAGNPVVVLQNLGLSWLPQWHFAVVIGYDLESQQVYLRSGNTFRRSMALKTFNATWARADFWSLVVLPPNKVPTTGDMTTYLRAASTLEAVGKTEAAYAAYQTALDNWPDSIHSETAYLGLANIAYGRKEFSRASQWLIRAINEEVATALTWNNLAYTLMASGCAQAALRSIECAVMLDAGKAAQFIESRQEIVRWQQQRSVEQAELDSLVCAIPLCR